MNRLREFEERLERVRGGVRSSALRSRRESDMTRRTPSLESKSAAPVVSAQPSPTTKPDSKPRETVYKRAKDTDRLRILDEAYSDPSDDWLSEPELEEEQLKKLVQSDALRAYGFVRRYVTQLATRIKPAIVRASLFVKTAIIPKVLRRKRLSLAVGAVMVIGIVVLSALTGGRPVVVTQLQEEGVLSDFDTETPPTFQTLQPADTTEPEVAFDKNRQIATYQGSVGESTITVTQQPLPAEFADDPAGNIQKLALSLTNKTSINQVETKKGVLYIAEDESGGQTGIFTHSSLLVFLTSAKPVAIDAWIDYVNALK